MPAAPNLTDADWTAIEREYCERSLSGFIRQSWPVLEPATPYVHGAHIDAICEHLAAVDRGEIRNLLINIPPRCMKSMLIAVMWPAWRWAHHPSTRWLFASYAQQLSVRDSLKMRRLIQSPWYQRLWGDRFALTDDQNAKMRFENDATGYRIATATGATATGEGGDLVVVDDPHSAQGASSEAQRESTLVWWDETMSTRLNDPKTGAKVIVMQRLHERDLSGHVLEQGGYEHLCLPLEYEPDRHCHTGIGWEDWRQEAGELLWPERIGPEEREAKQRELGDYGYAGQFQQRPAPRGGGMFPVDRFNIDQHPPQTKDILASVRYWDKAGTSDGGAYTVGVLMHKMRDGSFVVSDVVRGQWAATDREKRIRQTAEMDGRTTLIWVEQEPGSGGKESAEATIRNLAGYKVQADRVTGDKVYRADPYAAQVQGGNVTLIQAEWNRPFVSEHESFPNGTYKDQVDAAAGAFAKLSENRGAPLASWI
mgnify:CR=1 FL=1